MKNHVVFISSHWLSVVRRDSFLLLAALLVPLWYNKKLVPREEKKLKYSVENNNKCFSFFFCHRMWHQWFWTVLYIHVYVWEALNGTSSWMKHKMIMRKLPLLTAGDTKGNTAQSTNPMHTLTYCQKILGKFCTFNAFTVCGFLPGHVHCICSYG